MTFGMQMKHNIKMIGKEISRTEVGCLPGKGCRLSPNARRLLAERATSWVWSRPVSLLTLLMNAVLSLVQYTRSRSTVRESGGKPAMQKHAYHTGCLMKREPHVSCDIYTI